MVSGGNGYAAQNMRRLHFGLGEETRIEKVVIHWPSGRQQTLSSPRANALHSVSRTPRVHRLPSTPWRRPTPVQARPVGHRLPGVALRLLPTALFVAAYYPLRGPFS